MRKFITVLVLLLVCSLDGYTRYKEQERTLKLEWALAIMTLQRDILLTKIHNCKQKGYIK